MLKPFCGVALSALVVVSPVAAQTVNDARDTARLQWDSTEFTNQIVRACGMPRAYFKIEREYDGFARLRESPSITPDQHKCATSILQRIGIPVRK